MIEQAYKRNMRHINYTVKRLSDASYIDQDDLLSEANWIFVMCYKRFEAGKISSGFDTYFSKSLRVRLLDFMKKSRKRDGYEITSEPVYDSGFEDRAILKLTLEQLSPTAQVCLEVVFDSNENFEKIGKNCIYDGSERLARYINRNKNIPIRKVFHAFNEIKMAIA